MAKRDEVRAFFLSYQEGLPGDLDESDVFGSLSIDGDDADEFMNTFAYAFAVYLDAFRYYFHFIGDEPPVRRRVLPLNTEGKVIPFWPITLDQLTHAAEKGFWDVEYPPHTLRVKWMPEFVFAVVLLALAISGWLVITFID